MPEEHETTKSTGKIVERKGDKSKNSQTSVGGHFVPQPEPTDKSKTATTKAKVKTKK